MTYHNFPILYLILVAIIMIVITGLQLELDSTKASLRRTQSEKKVLKLEKGELEVSLSSANASMEARIKEEVSKERSKLQEKIASLESRTTITGR